MTFGTVDLPSEETKPRGFVCFRPLSRCSGRAKAARPPVSWIMTYCFPSRIQLDIPWFVFPGRSTVPMCQQKKALMDHMDEESHKITDTEVEIRRQR